MATKRSKTKNDPPPVDPRQLSMPWKDWLERTTPPLVPLPPAPPAETPRRIPRGK